MNTPTAYEIIIAAKLEQLPVPDMADSIWASIAMQLDADLPSDDGKKSSPQNSSKGRPGMGTGFYLCVLTAIIIAIVLIYKANKSDRKKNNHTPDPIKKEIVVPIADSNQSNHTPIEKITSNAATVVNKKDSAFNPFTPGNRISFDSLGQQALPLSKPDSSAIIKNKPNLPSFDSLPPAPLIKPRGVKGITDNDYRIQEGKKDSAKKER